MRAAIATALGDFKGDEGAFSTETKLVIYGGIGAGISHDFRWHDLRHTWASWHVQRGTRLQELMELGGWASYEMVLRYAHLATEQLREAASRIDDTNLTQRPNLRLVHSR